MLFCTLLQDDKKKFFRRGDLMAQEKEAYLEQQGKQKENASAPEKSTNSREYKRSTGLKFIKTIIIN